MVKKIFNPSEWTNIQKQENLDTLKKTTVRYPKNIKTNKDLINDIETIINKIEEKQTDITSIYGDWRNIGFAFADEFDENGRELFHRISRFYSTYTKSECDKQYNNCLKSKGQGVSIKTFFFLAKQAGLTLNNNKPVSKDKSEEMPNFPEEVFPQLPEFLKKVIQVCTSKEERDIMLLGSITTISSCLSMIYGIYDNKRVYANLFLFITAKASAGKGRLVHCKQLVKLIHKELRDQSGLLKKQYNRELCDYNAIKANDKSAEKPQKPQEKMLFIPANNSTTGLFQLLSDNKGKGLIFETEGDTLSQAFKSDYGNYSDGFRKAFHHETISYYRRTDREYVDIDSPCLSTVLSGTPKQISSLIPNAENGLFSRFIFYYMNIRPEWKDVFEYYSVNGLDDYFDNLGDDFYGLYKSLKTHSDTQFSLTTDQQSRFNEFFTLAQKKYISIKGIDYIATVRRLGLIAFRMTMVLSVLRILETGEISEKIICEEQDFKTVLIIVNILIQHSAKIYSELPEDIKPPKKKNKKEKLLANLPLNFNRHKYLEVARSLSIADKTAEGYITNFVKNRLIHRDSQDKYINSSLQTDNYPDNFIINKTQDIKEVKD